MRRRPAPTPASLPSSSFPSFLSSPGLPPGPSPLFLLLLLFLAALVGLRGGCLGRLFRLGFVGLGLRQLGRSLFECGNRLQPGIGGLDLGAQAFDERVLIHPGGLHLSFGQERQPVVQLSFVLLPPPQLRLLQLRCHTGTSSPFPCFTPDTGRPGAMPRPAGPMNHSLISIRDCAEFPLHFRGPACNEPKIPSSVMSQKYISRIQR